MNKKIDFSKGPVWKCIMRQAIPLTIAQIVQLLYNVVDRIYIGHLGEGNSLALTGIGLTFPLVTVIMAFTALFGNGGVPLFSMERGAKNEKQASLILGNSFSLLFLFAIILTLLGYIFLIVINKKKDIKKITFQNIKEDFENILKKAGVINEKNINPNIEIL